VVGLQQRQLAKDAGVDAGTISRMEAAGSKSPSGLSKNVEAVVLALEKRGVVITEHGVEFTGKAKRR
jgi:transcriptional regulator with XRE-family HTH domain